MGVLRYGSVFKPKRTAAIAGGGLAVSAASYLFPAHTQSALFGVMKSAIQLPDFALGWTEAGIGAFIDPAAKKLGSDAPYAGRLTGFFTELGYSPREAVGMIDKFATDSFKQEAAGKPVMEDENGNPIPLTWETKEEYFKGLWELTQYIAASSHLTIDAIAQSIPLMWAGGKVGGVPLAGYRQLLTASRAAGQALRLPAPRIVSQIAQRGAKVGVGTAGAAARGAAGEGFISGGLGAQDYVRETGTITPYQAFLAISSGTLTGTISAGSNWITRNKKLFDPETLLAGGKASTVLNRARRRDLVQSFIGSAFKEGFLEELPQSLQEQMLANHGMGRPLWEGVDEAAVMGTIVGMWFGAGAATPHILQRIGLEEREMSAAMDAFQQQQRWKEQQESEQYAGSQYVVERDTDGKVVRDDNGDPVFARDDDGKRITEPVRRLADVRLVDEEGKDVPLPVAAGGSGAATVERREAGAPRGTGVEGKLSGEAQGTMPARVRPTTETRKKVVGPRKWQSQEELRESPTGGTRLRDLEIVEEVVEEPQARIETVDDDVDARVDALIARESRLTGESIESIEVRRESELQDLISSYASIQSENTGQSEEDIRKSFDDNALDGIKERLILQRIGELTGVEDIQPARAPISDTASLSRESNQKAREKAILQGRALVGTFKREGQEDVVGTPEDPLIIGRSLGAQGASELAQMSGKDESGEPLLRVLRPTKKQRAVARSQKPLMLTGLEIQEYEDITGKKVPREALRGRIRDRRSAIADVRAAIKSKGRETSPRWEQAGRAVGRALRSTQPMEVVRTDGGKQDTPALPAEKPDEQPVDTRGIKLQTAMESTLEGLVVRRTAQELAEELGRTATEVGNVFNEELHNTDLDPRLSEEEQKDRKQYRIGKAEERGLSTQDAVTAVLEEDKQIISDARDRARVRLTQPAAEPESREQAEEAAADNLKESIRNTIAEALGETDLPASEQQELQGPLEKAFEETLLENLDSTKNENAPTSQQEARSRRQEIQKQIREDVIRRGVSTEAVERISDTAVNFLVGETMEELEERGEIMIRSGRRVNDKGDIKDFESRQAAYAYVRENPGAEVIPHRVEITEPGYPILVEGTWAGNRVRGAGTIHPDDLKTLKSELETAQESAPAGDPELEVITEDIESIEHWISEKERDAAHAETQEEVVAERSDRERREQAHIDQVLKDADVRAWKNLRTSTREALGKAGITESIYEAWSRPSDDWYPGTYGSKTDPPSGKGEKSGRGMKAIKRVLAEQQDPATYSVIGQPLAKEVEKDVSQPDTDTGTSEDVQPEVSVATEKGRAADQVSEQDGKSGEPGLPVSDREGTGTGSGQRTDAGGVDTRGRGERVETEDTAEKDRPERTVGTDEQEDKPKVASKPAEKRGVASDIYLTESDIEALTTKWSDADRRERNKNALELLSTMRASGRDPSTLSAEEKSVLIQYVGWGGLSKHFKKDDPHYQEIKDLIVGTFGEEAYKQAARSTQYAHYTSTDVIARMWAGALKMGFRGGTVLEPGAGVGLFLAMQPQGTRTGARQAIEMDAATAAILNALNPKTKVVHDTLASVRLVPDSVDLVIGNPPFSSSAVSIPVDQQSRAIHDPSLPQGYGGPTQQLHNYFFGRSIHALRPGGILMFVTSQFTMDNQKASGEKARLWMARHAKLVSGIRLPGGVFGDSSNTAVGTDILVFQKRESPISEEDAKKEPWVAAAATRQLVAPTRKSDVSYGPERVTVNTNPFFDGGAGIIAGELMAVRNRVASGGYTPGAVIKDADGVQIQKASDLRDPVNAYLDEWVEGLPSNIAVDPGTPAADESSIPEFAPKDLPIGSYMVRGDTLYVNDGSFLVKVEKSVPEKKSIRGQIDLASVLQEHIRTQLDEASTPEDVQASLKKLQQRYRRFIETESIKHKKKGTPLNSPSNQKAVKGDMNLNVLPVLENYKKAKGRGPGTATESAVLKERRLFPRIVPTSASNAKDALALTLAKKPEQVDLAGIEAMTGLSPDEVLSQLQGLIFKQPDGSWVTRENYLSGNVRNKLLAAEGMVESGRKDYEGNVEALKSVVPEDVPIEKISISLGQRWIPTEIYSDFAKHLFEKHYMSVEFDPLTSRYDVVAAAARKSGAFYIKKDAEANRVKVRDSDANTTKWGVPQLAGNNPPGSGLKLLTRLLNLQGPPVSRVKDVPADKNKRQTARYLLMYNKIATEFGIWLRSDPKRMERLSRIYNEKFNAEVVPAYDGSHLTFPGMAILDTSKPVEDQLRPHQKNAVWRVLSSGKNVGLAHVVGSGKTYTIAASIMEMRRTGLATKPMVTVPLPLLSQFANEFRHLYPTAKLLVWSDKEYKDNPTKFLNQIAFEDFDAVILPHTRFEQIEISEELQMQEAEQLLQEMVETKSAYQSDAIGRGVDAYQDGKDSASPTIKKMNKAIEAMEGKISKLQARIHDRSKAMQSQLNFEDLGIDALFVDEAHAFKNVPFTTAMTNIKGVPDPSSPAQRSVGMLAKVNYINSVTGNKNVVFATGTPVTNTLAETYFMMRYLDPGTLSELGIEKFDDFAATFFESEPVWESRPGQGLPKERQRLTKMKNAPEAIRAFRSTFDVLLNEDLDLPIPGLKGGAPTRILVKGGPNQRAYQREIGVRLKALDDGGVDPEEDNHLKLTGDARKAGLDLRLVGREPDEEYKILSAAEELKKRYDQYNSVHGTQLVFADLGVPKKETKAGEAEEEVAAEDIAVDDDGNEILFQVYQELKGLLVKEFGIPENEIAFAQDFKTAQDKALLREKVNSGELRIVVGSTETLGTGQNLQQRLVAVHHLDVPWTPAKLEQRDGRILRQGNLLALEGSEIYDPHFEVEIVRYMQQDSFDEAMWEIQLRKGTFIARLMRGDPNVREIEDLGNMVIDAEMNAALASGDPSYLEKAKLTQEINLLEIQTVEEEAGRRKALLLLKTLPDWQESEEQTLKEWESMAETISVPKTPTITVGSAVFEQKPGLKGEPLTKFNNSVNDALRDAISAVISSDWRLSTAERHLHGLESGRQQTPTAVGSYAGLTIAVTRGPEAQNETTGAMEPTIALVAKVAGTDIELNLTNISSSKLEKSRPWLSIQGQTVPERIAQRVQKTKDAIGRTQDQFQHARELVGAGSSDVEKQLAALKARSAELDKKMGRVQQPAAAPEGEAIEYELKEIQKTGSDPSDDTDEKTITRTNVYYPTLDDAMAWQEERDKFIYVQDLLELSLELSGEEAVGEIVGRVEAAYEKLLEQASDASKTEGQEFLSRPIPPVADDELTQQERHQYKDAYGEDDSLNAAASAEGDAKKKAVATIRAKLAALASARADETSGKAPDPAGEPQGQSKIVPVAQPELIAFLNEFTQGLPGGGVRLVNKIRGGGRGSFKDGRIKLVRDLWSSKNEKEAAYVIAHELGHLIDYIDPGKLARGNIIGRLKGFNLYLKKEYIGEDGEILNNEKLRDELKSLQGIWRGWTIEDDGEVVYRRDYGPDRRSGSKMSDADRTHYHQPAELYADAFSALMVDPSTVKAHAGTFYNAFLKNLASAKKDFSEAYGQLQDMLTQQSDASLQGKRFSLSWASYAYSEKYLKALQEERERRVRQRKHDIVRLLKHELLDKNDIVVDAVNRAEKKGERINPDLDPRRMLSRRNYLGSMLEAWTERNVQPIYRSIMSLDFSDVDFKITEGEISVNNNEGPMGEQLTGINLQTESPNSWMIFGKYLEMLRIARGDRSELPNTYGPKAAEAGLAVYEQQIRASKDGDAKWSELVKQQQAIQSILKTVQKSAYESGLYSDDLYKEIQKNDYYATFRSNKHLDSSIKAGIVRQVGMVTEGSNVATNTVEKLLKTLRAIEMNNVKKVAFDALQRHGAEVGDRATLTPTRRNAKGDLIRLHEGSGGIGVRPDAVTVTYFKNGKLHGFDVDPYIADSLNNRSVGENWGVIGLIKNSNDKWFRPVFTTMNLGFQGYNIFRDFSRFYKAMSIRDEESLTGISFARALKLYWKAIPLARMRAYGMPSKPNQKHLDALEDMLSAQENRILGQMFSDYATGKSPDEVVVLDAFEELRGARSPNPETRHNMLRGGWSRLLRFVKETGDFGEALPKAAALHHFKGEGSIEDISEEDKQFIRERVGSPDFLAGGTLKPVSNNLFLFSNAIIQGWSSDIKTATEPRTRMGYIWKTFQMSVIPKLLMAAAGAGWFDADGDDDENRIEEVIKSAAVWSGAGGMAGGLPGMIAGAAYGAATESTRTGRRAKESIYEYLWGEESVSGMMNSISGYDKLTKGLVLPLGRRDDGRVMYLAIPQDDTGRVVGAALWHAMGQNAQDQNFLQAMQSVVAYTVGQVPGMAPSIKLFGDLGMFVAGQNIYDAFRERTVFSKEEMETMSAFDKTKKFLGYEFHNFGFGFITPRFFLGDSRPREQVTWTEVLTEGKAPTLETWIEGPVLYNILGRFLRFSDYGETEQARAAAVSVQRDQRGDRENLQNSVNDVVTQWKENQDPATMWIDKNGNSLVPDSVVAAYRHEISQGLTLNGGLTAKQRESGPLAPQQIIDSLATVAALTARRDSDKEMVGLEALKERGLGIRPKDYESWEPEKKAQYEALLQREDDAIRTDVVTAKDLIYKGIALDDPAADAVLGRGNNDERLSALKDWTQTTIKSLTVQGAYRNATTEEKRNLERDAVENYLFPRMAMNLFKKPFMQDYWRWFSAGGGEYRREQLMIDDPDLFKDDVNIRPATEFLGGGETDTGTMEDLGGR